MQTLRPAGGQCMATTQSSGKKRGDGVAKAQSANGVASLNGIEPSTLLHHYQQMVMIRLFEEACLRGFRTGKIGGELPLYIWEEGGVGGVLPPPPPPRTNNTPPLGHPPPHFPPRPPQDG